MGLFSKLFGGKGSSLERRIEDEYFSKYSPLGLTRNDIRTAIADCKRKASIEGDDRFSSNFGAELIQRAKEGDDHAKIAVQNRINGGATEQDIVDWWNLHFIARRMMKWEDDISRLTTYSSLINEKDCSEEEALTEIKKNFPIYGDSTDESKGIGEDRPLPDELHLRINKLVVELTPIYIDKYKVEHSSMNAFLRHELSLDQQTDS